MLQRIMGYNSVQPADVKVDMCFVSKLQNSEN